MDEHALNLGDLKKNAVDAQNLRGALPRLPRR